MIRQAQGVFSVAACFRRPVEGGCANFCVDAYSLNDWRMRLWTLGCLRISFVGNDKGPVGGSRARQTQGAFGVKGLIAVSCTKCLRQYLC